MIEMADILRSHVADYLDKYDQNIPEMHLKAINDMLRCRTVQNGGKVYFCERCNIYQYSYHSCGNRNCNKCQNELIESWFEKIKDILLPVNHFLVTFTLPGSLRNLARSNQMLFYDLLLKAAAASIQELAYDTRFVGGNLGIIAILHTWGRKISFHPHGHFIVTGGGLFEDETIWMPAKKSFLVPVKKLSCIFRDKFSDLLEQENPSLYNQIEGKTWKSKWVVHSEAVGDGQPALKYLAQYVFKPALSNKRILSLKDDKVCFKYRDSDTKKWQTTKLDVLEFIHRYLIHVLPKGFVKVRYFGLYAHACKNKLEKTKGILPLKKECSTASLVQDSLSKEKMDNETQQKAGRNHLICPKCKQPLVFTKEIFKTFYYANGPPKREILLKNINFLLSF